MGDECIQGVGSCQNQDAELLSFLDPVHFAVEMQQINAQCYGNIECTLRAIDKSTQNRLTQPCVMCIAQNCACVNAQCESVCSITWFSPFCFKCRAEHCQKELLECSGLDANSFPHLIKGSRPKQEDVCNW
ncbi:hypothetical protein Pelo_7913 [Pelomyxa schiedti]|nr:hypothetical protein Pelo_7913 [Pelomyxa schiedti]